MAEFCTQCARELFDAEKGDFEGVGDPKDLPLKPGEGFPVICEGCGFVLVNEKGDCLGGQECTQEHHLRPPLDLPPKTPDFTDRMRDRERFTRDQHNKRDGVPPPGKIVPE